MTAPKKAEYITDIQSIPSGSKTSICKNALLTLFGKNEADKFYVCNALGVKVQGPNRYTHKVQGSNKSKHNITSLEPKPKVPYCGHNFCKRCSKDKINRTNKAMINLINKVGKPYGISNESSIKSLNESNLKIVYFTILFPFCKDASSAKSIVDIQRKKLHKINEKNPHVSFYSNIHISFLQYKNVITPNCGKEFDPNQPVKIRKAHFMNRYVEKFMKDDFDENEKYLHPHIHGILIGESDDIDKYKQSLRKRFNLPHQMRFEDIGKKKRKRKKKVIDDNIAAIADYGIDENVTYLNKKKHSNSSKTDKLTYEEVFRLISAYRNFKKSLIIQKHHTPKPNQELSLNAQKDVQQDPYEPYPDKPSMVPPSRFDGGVFSDEYLSPVILKICNAKNYSLNNTT